MAATSMIHRPPPPVETCDRSARLTLRGPTTHAVARTPTARPTLLRYRETETPAVGDGEVLLRVHAAGRDRGT